MTKFISMVVAAFALAGLGCAEADEEETTEAPPTEEAIVVEVPVDIDRPSLEPPPCHVTSSGDVCP